MATCRGRAEMGPRSLGNRSILADPRQISNIQKINTAIKNRDFWMPFSPIILDEYQNELIKNPKKILLIKFRKRTYAQFFGKRNRITEL